MKTTKMLIASALVATVAGTAHASVVAGFDFSQGFQSGLSVVDSGSGAATVQEIASNYSDLAYDSGNPGLTTPTGPNVYGSLLYNGTNGSTNVAVNVGTPDVFFQGGGLSSLETQMVDGAIFNANSSYNVLEANGQFSTNAFTLGVRNAVSLVFAVDLQPGFTGTDWSISYAALSGAGSVSIEWEQSLDGTAYTTIETDTISTTDSPYTVNFTLPETQAAFFRANVTGVSNANILQVDNVGVAATAVPEPATYALLFGVLAGALIVVRRRSRREK